MSDITETSLLLNVQIKDNDLVNRLAAIKIEQKNLSAANKELGKSFDENAADIVKNEVAFKALGKEASVLNNVLVQGTAQQKAQKGSLTEMRTEISKLKSQYADLSKEERENINVGGALQKNIAGLNVELKKIEGAYGDNQREVGNYRKGILEASKELNVFGFNVGRVQESFQKGGEGFTSFTKGVNTGKSAMVAFAAVPIILVITLVVAAIGKLASATDAVKDKVEQFTAGFGAAFDFLVNAVQNLIESGNGFKGFGDLFGNVITVITSPLRALIDLVFGFGKGIEALAKGDFTALKAIGVETFDKIKSNVVGTTQALDSAVKSTGALVGSFGELAAGAKNAFNEQKKLTAQLQDIDDAERALTVDIAKANQQSELAVIQGKNRTRTEQERIDLFQKANAAQEKAAGTELSLLQQRLVIAQKELEIRGRNGTNQDAEREKVYAANVKLIEAETNFANLKERNQNKIDLLQEQALAEQEKIRAKAYAAALADSKNRAQLLSDELERSLAIFDIEAKERVRAAQVAGQNVLLVEEVNAKERLKLERGIEQKRFEAILEFRKAQDDFEKKETEARLNAIQKEFETINGYADKLFNEQKLQLLKQLRDKQITQQQFDDRILANELFANHAKLENTKNFGKDTIALQQEIAAKETAIQKKSVAEQKALQLAKYQTASSVVKGLGALNTILEGDSENAKEIQKGLALAQIAINTAQAISGLVASSSENPLNAVTFGGAGIAQFAVGVVQILANIAQAKQLLSQAGGGGEFMTNGPTLLMVGDNPGGVERIKVEPISGIGQTKVRGNSLIQMAGGGSMVSAGLGNSQIANFAGSQIRAQVDSQNAMLAMMQNVQIVTKVTDIEKTQSKTAYVQTTGLLK